MQSLYDIKVLTWYEYEARMYAHRLKQVDEAKKAHEQAWYSVMAGMTKKQGSEFVPVYKNFTDFFDYEKELENVEKEQRGEEIITPKMKRMARIAKKANERR